MTFFPGTNRELKPALTKNPSSLKEGTFEYEAELEFPTSGNTHIPDYSLPLGAHLLLRVESNQFPNRVYLIRNEETQI